MCPLEIYGGGLYLGILSVVDIRTRKIPRWLLVLGMSGTILLKSIYKNCSIMLAVSGVAIGFLFCMISKITEETLGMGDSYLITILGAFVGGWNLLYILAYAFLFSAGYSVVVLIFCRFNRKIQIPFIPFLMAAYILWAC